TGAAVDQGDVFRGNNKIFAIAAGDDVAELTSGVVRIAALDDVVAGATVEGVDAAGIREDVVAITTAHGVITVTAVEAVIATVAIDRVVAKSERADNVIPGGTAEDRMALASVPTADDQLALALVLQVVRIRARGRGVIPTHQRRDLDAVDHDAASGIGMAQTRVELLALVDLEDIGRRRKNFLRQMRRVGVEHHHLGKRVPVELKAEAQARGTG